MKNLKLSIGMLLMSSLLVACSTSGGGGTAGAPGAAGAGTAGAGPGTAGVTCVADPTTAALAAADAAVDAAGTAGSTGAGGSTITDAGSATSADGKCIRNAFVRDGLCACQNDTPTACPTQCADLTADNDNCGACGMKCGPTSTCVAMKCTAAPTTALAAAPGCGSMSLAAAGGVVYITDKGHNTVKSVPAAGGAATAISTAEKAPNGVVVRGTKVFWQNNENLTCGTAASSKSTIRVSTAGAAATDVISVTATKKTGVATDTAIHGFTISDDGATVYFSTGTTVRKVATTGGAATDVAVEDHNGIPTALAIQGTLMAYPTDINGDVDVVMLGTAVAHCGKPGAVDPEMLEQINCIRIARSQGSLNQQIILPNGPNVIWIDGSNIKMNLFTPVDPLVPQDNKTIAPLDSPVRDMVLVGSAIYFVTFDDQAPTEGLVQKVAAIANQTATPLVRAQKAPSSIAVDGTKIFWTGSDCDVQTTVIGN